MSRIGTRAAALAVALGVASAVAAATDAVRTMQGEQRLQPFGGREDGRYVDGADLRAHAGPAQGSPRRARWEAARERGLEALVVRPDTRRGAYRDANAVHAAWRDDAP